MDLPPAGIGNARERLLAFQKLQQIQPALNPEVDLNQPLGYDGVPSTERFDIVDKPEMSAVDAQIQAYLRTPVRITEIDPEFQGFGNITTDMRPVTLDFNDDKMLQMPGIIMNELESQDVIMIGRAVIPMIATGFTRSGAAHLFTLAYNLMAPTGEYTEKIFSGATALESPGDKKANEFTENPMVSVGVYEPLTGGGQPEIESAVYSYIAMSLMRLFTKSPDNYVSAWTRIIEGYQKFHNDTISFNLPTPTNTAIKSLSDWFGIEPRAKQTLYRLLYMANDNDMYRGFKRFLFEIHLAHTGMHLASFFVNICKVLNCSSAVLLQVLNVREYKRQIDCLVAILKILKTQDPVTRRNMWKYGRIFDEAFMADIQTKSCPKLVYILGSALKMEAPSSYANFDKIAQLKDVSDVNKKRCHAIATKLIETIREYTNNPSGGHNLFSNIN
ncbi:N [Melampyrum roseum virus 1]|uniref:Nucleoprotein n=1 Tax=Melampyrum roseum virus 1 TaxID=2793732 RepID=A0A8D9UJ54_9RHAB|nr:N [Melampyrum roseum virus 1] [Melampyrum roseum virus 1]DAF42365.1 TPA_asm: N [Melampyrum roseum virus 1]